MFAAPVSKGISRKPRLIGQCLLGLAFTLPLLGAVFEWPYGVSPGKVLTRTAVVVLIIAHLAWIATLKRSERTVDYAWLIVGLLSCLYSANRLIAG